MSPSDVEKTLRFYMSKLPPDQLEELDAVLDGGAEPMASDARIGSEQDRRDWITAGHRARNAARSGHRNRMAQDSVAKEEFLKRFPNAARLK